MDSLRWEDYVLASGAGEVSKIWSAALELERRVTFVLGVGFDPRALVALKSLLTQIGNQVVQVVRLGLPSVEDDDLIRELTQANDRCLRELVESGVVEVASIAYPKEVESQAAGLRMSRQIQSSGVIGEKDLVVVDVSGLPSTVYFPVIGGLLEASDDRELKRDIQVVVCENPELDRLILEEGVASPGPINGFRRGLDPDDTSVTRVWVPVLGEHQEPYIRSIFDFLNPREVCPVLPFPARNPRRGDDLLVELRSLIFDIIEVEPRNFIYADERNPFDLYRGLCRLSDRYTKALKPLGNVTVVTSVHGSKILSVGALLAACVKKKLSVVSAGPTGYRIQPGVEIDKVATSDDLIGLWLEGEPYR